jgi:hypothetical protein
LRFKYPDHGLELIRDTSREYTVILFASIRKYRSVNPSHYCPSQGRRRTRRTPKPQEL